MIKKIIFSLIAIMTISQSFAKSLQDQINPNVNSVIKSTSDTDPINWIFSSVKDTIFWILAVVAIWVFLFIWARLVVARWNPEEFKKASMQLIYAVIWLVVVTLAYATVKLVSWLSL